MNESIIQIPPVDGKLIQVAFDIYTQMLENTKLLNKGICSICATYKGINLVKPRNHFHGSEFGQCFRKTQLDLITPKKNNQQEYFRNIFLADGHLHELSSIALLEQSFKISHKDEEKILERNVLLGENTVTIKIVLHTDCLLEFATESRQFIVEFKAVKDWYWKNRLANQQIPISYYGQCQMYMEAYNIPYTLLNFKNRHTSELHPPFVIAKNDEYIKHRFAYFAAIQYMIQQGELVPKEYQDKKCDACKFCKHFNICWDTK